MFISFMSYLGWDKTTDTFNDLLFIFSAASAMTPAFIAFLMDIAANTNPMLQDLSHIPKHQRHDYKGSRTTAWTDICTLNKTAFTASVWITQVH
jgi:hypothetical protein